MRDKVRSEKKRGEGWGENGMGMRRNQMRSEEALYEERGEGE